MVRGHPVECRRRVRGELLEVSDEEAVQLLDQMAQSSHTWVEFRKNGSGFTIIAWGTTGYGTNLKEALESWQENQSRRTLSRLFD